MIIKKESIADFSIFFYLFSSFVFSNIEATRWIYYICALLTAIILGLDVLRYRKLYTGGFLIRGGAFIMICFVSALLGVNTSVSIGVTESVFVNILFASLMLNYAINHKKTHVLIMCLCLAGISMTGYLFISEGVGKIIAAIVGGARIGGSIANENAVGMYAALSSVICLYYLKVNKNWKWVLPIPLTALIVLGSGSRMAFILLAAGMFMVAVIGLNARTIIKIILTITLLVFVILYVLSRPEFALIRSRLEDLFVLAQTGSTSNKSMNYRMLMINVGIKQFKANPIIGLGIGNSNTLLYGLIDNTYYLHNNYVELLASVGILGFCAFYSIYLKGLKIAIDDYRNTHNKDAVLVLILITMIIINDYSNVMYYKQEVYFVLIIAYSMLANKYKR